MSQMRQLLLRTQRATQGQCVITPSPSLPPSVTPKPTTRTADTCRHLCTFPEPPAQLLASGRRFLPRWCHHRDPERITSVPATGDTCPRRALQSSGGCVSPLLPPPTPAAWFHKGVIHDRLGPLRLASSFFQTPPRLPAASIHTRPGNRAGDPGTSRQTHLQESSRPNKGWKGVSLYQEPKFLAPCGHFKVSVLFHEWRSHSVWPQVLPTCPLSLFSLLLVPSMWIVPSYVKFKATLNIREELSWVLLQRFDINFVRVL